MRTAGSCGAWRGPGREAGAAKGCDLAGEARGRSGKGRSGKGRSGKATTDRGGRPPTRPGLPSGDAAPPPSPATRASSSTSGDAGCWAAGARPSGAPPSPPPGRGAGPQTALRLLEAPAVAARQSGAACPRPPPPPPPASAQPPPAATAGALPRASSSPQALPPLPLAPAAPGVVKSHTLVAEGGVASGMFLDPPRGGCGPGVCGTAAAAPQGPRPRPGTDPTLSVARVHAACPACAGPSPNRSSRTRSVMGSGLQAMGWGG
jgi:hypothetical protein